MSERLRKFVFWTLLVLGLFGYRIGRAQEPSLITVRVQPKVAIVNPYKRTAFWFQWQIEPDHQNRRYTLSYSCGAELHSSQGELDGKSARTTERYVELTVLEDCLFVACVIKIVDGNSKTFCAWAKVITGGGDV